MPVNEFILKELTILPIKCNQLTKPINFHFQSACQWTCVLLKYRNINRWLENNLHGIPSSSGDVLYKMIKVIIENISKNSLTIYIKGSEKKNWLKRFTKPSTKIFDMLDLRFPSLQHLKNETKIVVNVFIMLKMYRIVIVHYKTLYF